MELDFNLCSFKSWIKLSLGNFIHAIMYVQWKDEQEYKEIF